MSVVEKPTLYDIDAYSQRQIAEIASVLMDKVSRIGWQEMPVDEQVQLRLLRTLLDGFSE